MFGDLDWPINASRRFVSDSWVSCWVLVSVLVLLIKVLVLVLNSWVLTTSLRTAVKDLQIATWMLYIIITAKSDSATQNWNSKHTIAPKVKYQSVSFQSSIIRNYWDVLHFVNHTNKDFIRAGENLGFYKK